MGKIIVGVDESQGSSDAIALASSLARITGSTLMLVNVFPYDHPSRRQRDFENLRGQRRSARAPAQQPWRRDRRGQGDRQCLARPRAARARRAGGRRLGRGGLHPHRPRRTCAARQHRRAAPARIALPGRGGAEGLRAAIERRARDHRLRLRRLAVRRARARDRAPRRGGDRRATEGDPRLHAAGLRHPARQRAAGRPGLVQRHAARARHAGSSRPRSRSIDAEPGVEADFAVGDPAEILTEASEQLDLLVLGSRGYGPLHAVLVGGVAGASCATRPAP